MTGNKTILSAFDMALYDILGKRADLPLYALLAGSKRTLITDRTIGIDTPGKMVEEAIAYKEQGIPAIKVKLGTTVAEDIERIRHIRAALGPQIPLRIDANQGWDRIGALQALRGMEDKGIQYCEQPVAAWDFESMRMIALETTIPIMADESLFDEHDAYKLIAGAACDCLNIKLAKSGGIHVALKINAIAEAAGMWCMIGCMSETRLGLTAAAHLAAARPNIRYTDLDSAHLLTLDPVIGGMTYGAGGTIELPNSPGLGTTIDPSFLASLESFVVE
jgi:L-alanine-DL-glutamate epimerase-like enolase superfamily enzyme